MHFSSSASSILSSLLDEIRTSNVDTNNSNNSSSAIQMDIEYVYIVKIV